MQQKNEVIYTSYYVPTNEGLSCVKSYEISKNFKNKNCSSFFGNLINAVEKNTGMPIPYKFVERRAGDPAELYSVSMQAKDILNWEPQFSNLDTIIESMWKMYID